MKNKLVLICLAFLLTLPLVTRSARSGNPSENSDSFELAEVNNLEKFELSSKEKRKLKERGFFLSKTPRKTIYEIYEENRSGGIPNFITTDLILHTTHLLYSYSLKVLEYKELSKKLAELTERMVELTSDQYHGLEEGELKKRAKFNLAFFSVPEKLLNPSREVPDPVRSAVKDEIDLINKSTGTGIRTSPLFGYKLDYSSFLPRGHYEETERLKKYFKALNWYGRGYFRVKPGSSTEAAKQGRKETVSALLMVKLLKNDPETYNLWRIIEGFLNDLAGPAENLQLPEYEKFASEIFGKKIDLKEIKNSEKMDDFRDKTLKSKKPTTLPLWAASRQVSRDFARSFCFLGKRYDRGAEIFQNLVYPEVGADGKGRTIPSGLDVMAAFGSGTAEKVLKKRGAFDYANYEKQLEELKGKFAISATGKNTRSGASLKDDWYEILKTLVGKKPGSEKRPFGKDWEKKQLNTALGSWTEMKHDTVLYSKRSTAMARGVVKTTEGYVEARPEVYEKVLKLTDSLLELDSLPRGMRDKLKKFNSFLGTIEDIARRELSGKKLTEEGIESIFGAGNKLKEIASYPAYLKNKEDKTREAPRMALAVDVHQDPQTNLLLHEALGNPFSLVAVIKRDGEKKLTRGGTYSYYEFTKSTENPLTDDKWAELLDDSGSPKVTEWLRTLFP